MFDLNNDLILEPTEISSLLNLIKELGADSKNLYKSPEGSITRAEFEIAITEKIDINPLFGILAIIPTTINEYKAMKSYIENIIYEVNKDFYLINMNWWKSWCSYISFHIKGIISRDNLCQFK